MTYRGSTVNMVDCGNVRCYQERRLIKKELMSWSKKIPLVVGLEAVAEQVGSRRKVRKLFEPFNCLEPKEPQDWEPEENCFYCKDRIQLLFDAIEKSDSREGGKILKDHPSLRHLGEVLPFLPQFYTSDFGRDILTDIKSGSNEATPTPPPPPSDPSPRPNIELKVPAVSSPGPSNKSKKESPQNGKKGYSNEDLSAAMTEVKNGKLGTRRAASLYGVPRSTLRNKMFKPEEEECQISAAMLMEDDNSSSDVPRHLLAPSDVPSLKHLQQFSFQDRPLMLTDLLQLSSLQYMAPMAIPYFLTPEMISMQYAEETELERRIQAIRHKHNISRASMSHYKAKALANHKMKPFQYELIRKLTRERYQQEMKSLKGKKREEKASHSLESRDFKLSPQSHRAKPIREYSSPTPPPNKRSKREHKNIPMLDSGAVLQSALYKALNVNHPFLSTVNESNSSESDTAEHTPDFTFQSHPSPEGAGQGKEEDIERKIYDSLFKYENTRIGDTLKDIIVKTISEKVKCKLESTDFSGLIGASSSQADKQKAKETILSAFSLPDTAASPPKRSRRGSHSREANGAKSSSTTPSSTSTLSNASNSSSSGSPVKKTRPKRGQYRKYNSQLLTEAVKAVQRGEMSVHRAGSYYGVPHSTLEYKVKERHLLRQKKIKEQQELKQKQAEEEAKKKEEAGNSTSSSDRESSPVKKTAAGDSTNHSSAKSSPPATGASSWLPPISSGSLYENAAALGLFGSGYALNAPASDLLRKLQHKVQS
ncbi:mushroom body large-type Kenyon cell-specific protein 1-like [Mya arenaria]|uniref:mushroom body large-type Kenyon cell-specific protein 1-like n=1 Tax=Mya arenaria TaxID=6604 RepID=UPI0022DF719B|nr:mushroom body large-type Kenyon cell-specific protein 1-like [Mya arenaria]